MTPRSTKNNTFHSTKKKQMEFLEWGATRSYFMEKLRQKNPLLSDAHL